MRNPLLRWLAPTISLLLGLAVVHCFCWTATNGGPCPTAAEDEVCCCGTQDGPQIQARALSQAVLHKGADRLDRPTLLGIRPPMPQVAWMVDGDALVPRATVPHPPDSPRYLRHLALLI